VKRSDTGRYVTSIAGSEEVRAFVPAPLPPVPALELIGGVRNSLDQGLLALGRLDGAAGTLPDAHLLLYTLRPERSGPVLANRRHAIDAR